MIINRNLYLICLTDVNMHEINVHNSNELRIILPKLLFQISVDQKLTPECTPKCDFPNI